ncbi:UPF0132 membrane protein [Smittium culicis]|uniref:UPF0132 membrane protein n=1 Tax=Smittium culicis TaxID=133412 RepID=A0A1R1XQG2_9FUNG|nr:UPF0132 membrane protein [Smittium culicis]
MASNQYYSYQNQGFIANPHADPARDGNTDNDDHRINSDTNASGSRAYPNTSTSSHASGDIEAGYSADGGLAVSRYATTLPIRLDFEAAFAYSLGCLSGIFLLVFERQNDYVRFHAYQSLLLSIIVFIASLILCTILPNFIVFVSVVSGYSYIAYQAYKDAAVLEYTPLPFVGHFALQWVNSE